MIVSVLWLFFTVPRVCLQCVIVIYHNNTYFSRLLVTNFLDFCGSSIFIYPARTENLQFSDKHSGLYVLLTEPNYHLCDLRAIRP